MMRERRKSAEILYEMTRLLVDAGAPPAAVRDCPVTTLRKVLADREAGYWEQAFFAALSAGKSVEQAEDLANEALRLLTRRRAARLAAEVS
jgi:hypothetical protein